MQETVTGVTELETSKEQTAIIKTPQEPLPSVTMKIDACAGSGKMTTLIGIANANPGKKLYMESI